LHPSARLGSPGIFSMVNAIQPGDVMEKVTVTEE